MPNPDLTPSNGFARRWQNTEWSDVIFPAAGKDRGLNDDQIRAAREALFKAYSNPLYDLAVSRGWARDRAAELINEFFLFIFERDKLRDVDKSAGRFRDFLKWKFRGFLADERRREGAGRRGGGRPPVSLDRVDEDGRRLNDPEDERSFEKDFDRRWAMGMLERAVERFKAEMIEKGLVGRLNILLPAIENQPHEPYIRLAEELGTSEANVKKMVTRYRERLGEILRDEVRPTVAAKTRDAEERESLVDDEIRHLFEALA
jgi:RNA polymerase sigma-70 factor (ECF subfamily)